MARNLGPRSNRFQASLDNMARASEEARNRQSAGMAQATQQLMGQVNGIDQQALSDIGRPEVPADSRNISRWWNTNTGNNYFIDPSSLVWNYEDTMVNVRTDYTGRRHLSYGDTGNTWRIDTGTTGATAGTSFSTHVYDKSTRQLHEREVRLRSLQREELQARNAFMIEEQTSNAVKDSVDRINRFLEVEFDKDIARGLVAEATSLLHDLKYLVERDLAAKVVKTSDAKARLDRIEEDIRRLS